MQLRVLAMPVSMTNKVRFASVALVIVAIGLLFAVSIRTQLCCVVGGSLIRIAKGGIQVVIADPPFDPEPRFLATHHALGVLWVPEWTSMRDPRGRNYPVMIFIPFWFAMPFLVVGLWYWRPRRYDSDGFRRCKVCEYNLYQNTSGVCPECGSPVADRSRE